MRPYMKHHSDNVFKDNIAKTALQCFPNWH